MTVENTEFRAGFASVVGRPNAGKSTLTNAMVGKKVAITSARPETTRRIIRAIVTRDAGQVILVDTPGMHRPRTLLGERLGDMVRDSIADVDTNVMCLPANEKLGPGDKYLLDLAVRAKVPMIAAITKTDLVSREALAEKIAAVAAFHDFVEIVPVSAATLDQVEVLTEQIIKQLPVSPPLYPLDAITDETEETLIAELIREAGLEKMREELPHSLAVTIDEIIEDTAPNGGPLVRVHASLHVERDSQKGIVIGRGGARLRQIGRDARKAIKALLGTPVYLDLHVKVSKDWQRDPKMLDRLGF
ncbi:GTPase Era [Actinotignum sanguinis]|uniref:GTPase Era n=1 Tax=Actinotignum sanguinis TaxID=1445614 RepID=UPI00237D4E68|nr:GTPase Era [Actinotignum sanguinis]MDE1552110.1 GTPase Era [Actinotignum sanguinis]